MAAGVVAVGRLRYAVGLYWENSPGSGRVAQIAKEAAQQPGQQADFYAVRPGNKDGRVPQFGLCSGEAGQVSGMPVLAGCLASQIPGSWAGAFRLTEGVVVIVVRDDLIVPDGDLFFIDEAEARDRLIQEIGFGGLQTTYAPESWSIPGADTIPLTLLLSDHKDIKLQRVRISKRTKIIVAAVITVFLIAFAIVFYEQMKEAQDETARMEREEALRRAEQATNLPNLLQQQAPPPPKYERKWEDEPPAIDIINLCHDGLERVPTVMAGWNLSTMKCSKNGINLSWTRDKYPAVPMADMKVNDSGTSATQTIILPALKARGSEDLLNIDEITNRYLDQNWPGSIARIADDPPPPPPPDYKGTWNPPPPPWVKRSFTLHVPQLPASLANQIGNLPGAVVDSLTYTPSTTSSSWLVEGVIYENRK